MKLSFSQSVPYPSGEEFQFEEQSFDRKGQEVTQQTSSLIFIGLLTYHRHAVATSYQIYCNLMYCEETDFIYRPSSSSLQSESLPFSQTDLSYEICSTLLKHTGQKFSIKEADLMQTSRTFLQTFSTFAKKDFDSSRTLDTLRDEGREKQISHQDQQNLALFRPKSPNYGGRKNALVMGKQLAQIEQRCSYSCFVFVSSLVAEYKKQQAKIRSYQSRDLSSFKLEEQNQRFHEENIILRQKLQHQQQDLIQLHTQLQTLKLKVDSNYKNCSLSHSERYGEINNKVYRDIRSYLSEKEAILHQQSSKITATENEVLKAIEMVFESGSCQKCCEILSKLKESIMKIKKYLEGQCLQFEQLYDKYKKTMYTIKCRN